MVVTALRQICALSVALLWTGPVAAQAGVADRRTDEDRAARPHGMAELGLGWLTLPGAQVCTRRTVDTCKQGDSSPAVEVWQLYRASNALAFGAGITLGLIPTNDAFGSEVGGVQRDHSRSYFSIEGIARYYPWAGPSSEFWAGITGGLVVVSDTYSSAAPAPERVLIGGKSGATIRTEGYTVGLAGGGDYRFAENWSVGLHLRYGSWFLPKEAAKDAFKDEASLTGRNSMFAFGLAVAYRIPL